MLTFMRLRDRGGHLGWVATLALTNTSIEGRRNRHWQAGRSVDRSPRYLQRSGSADWAEGRARGAGCLRHVGGRLLKLGWAGRSDVDETILALEYSGRGRNE